MTIGASAEAHHISISDISFNTLSYPSRMRICDLEGDRFAHGRRSNLSVTAFIGSGLRTAVEAILCFVVSQRRVKAPQARASETA